MSDIDKPDKKDLERARQFVNCELARTGRRFQETVDVLVEKLKGVRKEAQRG